MLNTFFYFTHTIQWLASFLYIYLFTSTLPSCPYREKVADFYQNAKKIQVWHYMPHKIYTNYKCGKTCLTGYTQNTSDAEPASQDIYKLQVLHNLLHRIYTIYKWYMTSVLPSQKAVSNRFWYLTGYWIITSGQNIYVIPHRSNPRQGQVLTISNSTLSSLNETSIFIFSRIDQN